MRAADKVIEKAKPIAAHLLEASRRRPRVRRRPVHACGAPTRAWRSARSRPPCSPPTTCPTGVEPSLDSDATYDPVNFSFPHGTHLCAMEVDTETGGVKMRKYVCVDDIGNIINPLIVAGQVHGGLVQGIAQALWEEAVLRRAGHPGVRLVRRLPAADGGRHDQLRDRPHDLARRTHQHAGHQGRRRGGHASPRRRRWSTRSSTPYATSASTTSRCRARPSGCGRRSTTREPGGGPTDGAAAAALRRVRPACRAPSTGARRCAVIPAQFDYVAPTSVEEALAALAEHGDDAKIMAGGQSLLPVLRMRLNAPEIGDRPRPDRRAARDPRRRRRPRHRRDDHAPRGRAPTTWCSEHAGC